jgi:GntR family transcriptional repressor for pyruvate dehydrogenase complex
MAETPQRSVRFSPLHQGASEQIALEIRRYLVEQELRPGDRVGTEQELAAEFGVTRPTLREALRLLAGSHLIRASRGPGGGIFVANTPNEGISLNLSESIATLLASESVSLHQLLEARTFLEVPLAGLAAENADEQSTRDLEAAIDEGAEDGDPSSEAFCQADARFPWGANTRSGEARGLPRRRAARRQGSSQGSRDSRGPTR